MTDLEKRYPIPDDFRRRLYFLDMGEHLDVLVRLRQDDAFYPAVEASRDTLIAYIPAEMVFAPLRAVDCMLEWCVSRASGNPIRYSRNKDLVRYMASPMYRLHRSDRYREVNHLSKAYTLRLFSIPAELNPVLAPIYEEMRVCYYEGKNVVYSDYISRTLVISRELLDDERPESRLFLFYLIYREMAVMASVDATGKLNKMRFHQIMKRAYNKETYEKKCLDMGIKFRYCDGLYGGWSFDQTILQ